MSFRQKLRKLLVTPSGRELVFYLTAAGCLFTFLGLLLTIWAGTSDKPIFQPDPGSGLPMSVYLLAIIFAAGVAVFFPLMLWSAIKIHAGFRDGYRKKVAALGKETKAQKKRIRNLEADVDIPNARKGIEQLCYFLMGCRRNLILCQLRDLVEGKEWNLTISRDDKTKENKNRVAALKKELKKAGFKAEPTLKSAAEYVQPRYEGIAAIVEINLTAADLLSYESALQDLMSAAYRWSLIASDDSRKKFEVRENKELETDEIRFILLPPRENEWPPNREPVTGIDIPEEKRGGN